MIDPRLKADRIGEQKVPEKRADSRWQLDAVIAECLSTDGATAVEFAADRADRSKWATSSER